MLRNPVINQKLDYMVIYAKYDEFFKIKISLGKGLLDEQ